MTQKILAVFAVATFAVLMVGSAVAPAFAANEKVALCHVNSGNDSYDLLFGTVIFGNVIEVSEKAASKHIENHGDSEAFTPMTEELRDLFEEFLEITLPNSDCFFLEPTV